MSSYDDEPVYYCGRCLSLNVKTVDAELDLDYCDDCGSTEIKRSLIEEWCDMYKGRYGRDYINKR